MAAGPDVSDDITLNEFVLHKIEYHLADSLRQDLKKRPNEKSRQAATTRALRATHTVSCEFEANLFNGNHELRDALNALIRERELKRLTQDTQTRAYEVSSGPWKSHKKRLDELRKGRAEELEAAERKRIENARLDQLAAERMRDRRAAEQQEARVAAEIAETELAQQRLREAEADKRAKQLQSRQKDFLKAAQRLFDDDYLAFEVLETPPDLGDLSPQISEIRMAGIRKWLKKISPNLEFEPEQIDAIGSVQGNTLVTARAGSGKTTVLTYRALFMLLHCRIPSREMLLVTFNHKAADEMRRRIQEKLSRVAQVARSTGIIEMPDVRTFHSIAYRINEAWRISENLPPIARYLRDEGLEIDSAKTDTIKEVLQLYLQEEQHVNDMHELMFRHFSSDWLSILRPILATGFDPFVDWENMDREAMDGTTVKSRGERLIADVLFRHGIDYQYERALRNGELGNARPDFTVLSPENQPIVIEFLGLHGEPSYDALNNEKFEGFRLQRIPVLKILPQDLLDQISLRKMIIAFLTLHLGDRIPVRELSHEELLEKLKKRSTTHFESMVTAFIGRCRVESLEPSDVIKHAHQMHVTDMTDEIERDFYLLAAPILERYLRHLDESHLEDFDGLITVASNAIQKGQTKYASSPNDSRDLREVRFVSIDEYQDFSKSFETLVRIITALNSTHVFVVGDDWQSINSFMGAIPDVFERFSKRHDVVKGIVIPVNQRSSRQIVDFGNSIMSHSPSANPATAKPGRNGPPVRFVDVSEIEIDQFGPEHEIAESGRRRSVALARIAEDALARKLSVTFLSHFKKFVRDFQPKDKKNSKSPIDDLSSLITRQLSRLPDSSLSGSTAHAFKGQESDVVVILDADSASYPFIHSDWIFTRIFGTTIDRLVAEEQRLAYVASTRARRELYVLSNGHPSAIFPRQAAKFSPPRLDISLQPQAGRIWLVVKNGYHAKEHLKEFDFKWVKPSKSWVKEIQSEKSLEDLRLDLLKSLPEWLVRARDLNCEVYVQNSGDKIPVV